MRVRFMFIVSSILIFSWPSLASDKSFDNNYDTDFASAIQFIQNLQATPLSTCLRNCQMHLERCYRSNRYNPEKCETENQACVNRCYANY